MPRACSQGSTASLPTRPPSPTSPPPSMSVREPSSHSSSAASPWPTSSQVSRSDPGATRSRSWCQTVLTNTTAIASQRCRALRRLPCQYQCKAASSTSDSARPVEVGPCHCGSQRSGIAARCRKGHSPACASGASQRGCKSQASTALASEKGSSTATIGTTSRFANGAVHAKLPNASTVTGAVSTNGPRHPRHSCSHRRCHADACGGMGTCAATRSPITPAMESANPASSAVAGDSPISTTAEKASDSTTST